MIVPITYRTVAAINQLLAAPLTQRKREFLRAREAYYNTKDGRAIMKDEVFDRLEKSIALEDPEWKHLKKTGAPVKGKKFKRELASFMPSLSKFYPEHEAKLLKWASTAPRWVVSAKMDGSSVQAEYDYSAKGALVALSTRGNGVIGKSIDHFIPALLKAGILPVAFTAFTIFSADLSTNLWS
jgi:NAD-dependent DNA ligase